jgi:ribosome-binding factor A
VSVRTDRISATIRKALQEAIARGVHDPRVRGLITVTAVEVSPDLRTAIVRVSVLPESAQELTLHGLTSAAGRLRREIGESVRMKRLPDLVFVLDDTLKRQARVLSAISRAREEQAAGEEKAQGGETGASNDGGPREPEWPDRSDRTETPQ